MSALAPGHDSREDSRRKTYRVGNHPMSRGTERTLDTGRSSCGVAELDSANAYRYMYALRSSRSLRGAARTVSESLRAQQYARQPLAPQEGCSPVRQRDLSIFEHWSLDTSLPRHRCFAGDMPVACDVLMLSAIKATRHQSIVGAYAERIAWLDNQVTNKAELSV